MSQYRLTINLAGKKAGAVIELDDDDSLVVGGYALPVDGAAKPAPAPVKETDDSPSESAPSDDTPDDAPTDEKAPSRRRQSNKNSE